MTTAVAQHRGTDQAVIRPFQVNVPESELTELRRRVTATRFPEKETVTDFSQGVQLAVIQALARYWATDYNWRRCEALHFAAWEQPQLFSEEVRAGFRSLRG